MQVALLGILDALLRAAPKPPPLAVVQQVQPVADRLARFGLQSPSMRVASTALRIALNLSTEPQYLAALRGRDGAVIMVSLLAAGNRSRRRTHGRQPCAQRRSITMRGAQSR